MSKRLKIAVAAAAPCIAAAVFCIKDCLFKISEFIPACSLYSLTGYYCPACGNTRSVKALLSGNIPLAVRNNITIPFLAAALILLYAELIADIGGIKLRLLPRSGIFWGMVIGLFTAYYIVRNFIGAIAPI